MAGRPDVPGYELLDVVGHGPLGVVYRARAASGALMALKIFNAVVRWRPDFVVGFERETSLALSLHHANILQIQQRGRAGENYFIAYDLMPGGSLRERLRGGKMALRPALRVGVDVGRALDHAHLHRVLHRALKPENVFILPSGVAKVSDFSQTRLSGHDLQIGRYSPPEEKRISMQRDGRADVYAAAYMLFELLMGENPLHPLQPVSARVAGADHRLDAFFRRALSRSPDERFHRASEMTAALVDLLEREAGEPTGSADSPVVVTVEKNVVRVYVRQRLTPEVLARGLQPVELAVQGAGSGRWRLAYDLTALESMGIMENAALIALHERCRDKLESVSFHSSIPQVRGSALVVGGSVHGLPFKVFDSAESMKRFLSLSPSPSMETRP